MKKIFKILLVICVPLVFIAYIIFVSMLSGGLKGLWYDTTKPNLDPYDPTIVNKREITKNNIVKDFDYIDTFSSMSKYGIHNTDLCIKKHYGFKNPMDIWDHLYTCKYISQRYYGLTGEFNNVAKDLINFIEKNKEGLTFQPYDKEQLFVQREWVNDARTTNQIIAEHNIRNKDNPASDIYDVISFLEGQQIQSVYSYSPSNDRYTVRLDFFDWGASPSSVENSDLYEIGDTPDLRQKYVDEINKKHPYGIVVTVTQIYYER